MEDAGDEARLLNPLPRALAQIELPHGQEAELLLQRYHEDHAEVDETKGRPSHPPPTAEAAQGDHDRAPEDEGDDREVQRDDEISEPETAAGISEQPVHATVRYSKTG